MFIFIKKKLSPLLQMTLFMKVHIQGDKDFQVLSLSPPGLQSWFGSSILLKMARKFCPPFRCTFFPSSVHEPKRPGMMSSTCPEIQTFIF